MSFKQRKIADSIAAAAAGFSHAFRHERNLRIHCVAALFVGGLAVALRMDGLRLAVLVVIIGGVIGAELFNTAVEAAVDLSTQQVHPLAKKAKDVAAAAVLVQAFVAVVVGYFLFQPYVSWAVAALPFGFWSSWTILQLRNDKEVSYDDAADG